MSTQRQIPEGANSADIDKIIDHQWLVSSGLKPRKGRVYQSKPRSIPSNKYL